MGEALELVVVGLGDHLDRTSGDPAPPDDVGDPGEPRDLDAMLRTLAVPGFAPADVAPQSTPAYAQELHAVWEAWANFRTFPADETFRALDTAARLLASIGADRESAAVRELATVPLAVFAAGVLAEHVAGEPERDEAMSTAEPEPRDRDGGVSEEQGAEAAPTLGDDATRPVRLRAVPREDAAVRRTERDVAPNAPASIRALRAVDPALPLVTWSELSDTITALLSTGRLDAAVLTAFTRRTLDERARTAVETAAGRGLTIRPEHVVWVVSVLRNRYAGEARVTRASATALVAEYIASLAPRAGVDPRRVRQDMMAWVDVERA